MDNKRFDFKVLTSEARPVDVFNAWACSTEGDFVRFISVDGELTHVFYKPISVVRVCEVCDA